MPKPLPDPHALKTVMQRGKAMAVDCDGLASEYTVLTSIEFPDRILFRWVCTDVTNLYNISQSYRYLCFTLSGEPMYCSLIHTNSSDANHFTSTLIIHLTQP